jgi:pimeloyl-ACP methyl ester carboxylesterase
MSVAQTDTLDLHFVDTGPRDGPAALLLHGWPDDVHTWEGVAAHLNSQGWRTVVPYLRGFGPNRFRSADTPRSGQLTALASDVLALANRLDLERFALIGHDWGARTAYVLAALHPERLTHCVALSVGYGTTGAPSLLQAQQFWYQWFFALPHGEAALREDRRAVTRHLWQSWSPSWHVDDTTFSRTAAAFDNPDWLDVTLHGYRHRWGLVDGDARHAAADQRLATVPPITVPTLVLHGDDDRCIVPASSASNAAFRGAWRRDLLPGVGHFPQREATDEVARRVHQWLTTSPSDLK